MKKETYTDIQNHIQGEPLMCSIVIAGKHP